jgi:hypothetical protein
MKQIRTYGRTDFGLHNIGQYRNGKTLVSILATTSWMMKGGPPGKNTIFSVIIWVHPSPML